MKLSAHLCNFRSAGQGRLAASALLIFLLAFSELALAASRQQKRGMAQCNELALSASEPLTSIQLENQFGRNLRASIPRYDVRIAFENWLQVARRDGVQVADDVGTIPLTGEFVISFERFGQTLTIKGVGPGADAASSVAKTKIAHAIRDKDLNALPVQVREAFAQWQSDVANLGLFEVRRGMGGSYHDEGLSGQREGQRSVRLNRQWRVIYVETGVDSIQVLEIMPHTY